MCGEQLVEFFRLLLGAEEGSLFDGVRHIPFAPLEDVIFVRVHNLGIESQLAKLKGHDHIG